MKALMLDHDDTLHLGDVPSVMPGAGEVAIDVAYAGVQWGDVLVLQGHFATPRPFVPGFEAAGRISDVGAGVDPARIGESVAALTSGGAFAQQVIAPADLSFGLGGIDPRVGAAFGWATPTAYDLINTVGAVRRGDRVLIHAAAGGVGSRAAQFARAAEASEIVGVVASQGQIGYASRFGYTGVLEKDAFPGTLAEERFDVILDPIGGATRATNLGLLAPHGRLVVYGNISSWDSYQASTNDLLMSGQSLMTYNSNLLSQTNPARLATSARAALAQVAAGEIEIAATAEYALADTAQAIEHLATGQILGKSIVHITD